MRTKVGTSLTAFLVAFFLRITVILASCDVPTSACEGLGQCYEELSDRQKAISHSKKALALVAKAYSATGRRQAPGEMQGQAVHPLWQYHSDVARALVV